MHTVRLTLLLLAACGIAQAGGLDNARQRGTLQAGIQYVVPEYRGGMKFRTPETLDQALLEDVAKRLKLPLATVKGGKTDLALATVTDNDPLVRTHTVIPTGYTSAPMAIMRNDTDIKTWEQLKGRKVCVSEGGVHTGTIAARYGAIEKVYRAPADAFIAVRIGECDATVHDSAMLEELIRYPEWKKFSARLPAGPRTTLAFVVPAADRKTADYLKKVVADWTSTGQLDKLMKSAVRNIAFEVYLDQTAPDCH
ncbi:transporter substrate-binding domain-containing protein [Noviherbaspirillum denitrificans]|uniref:ABC transporter substrate-binding protein n=1 Tax=Noviherbaspirillum denitrificans TaxID=1968433 RepID=A0A254TF35_9BURK|nr:transporter substrate-binding domain-containing protein [Noviherbaspirillum denitrificans]OWW21224.1 ABC transporter substrate-binding protein [Noviherbaspirillum denitrificans]